MFLQDSIRIRSWKTISRGTRPPRGNKNFQSARYGQKKKIEIDIQKDPRIAKRDVSENTAAEENMSR